MCLGVMAWGVIWLLGRGLIGSKMDEGGSGVVGNEEKFRHRKA